VLNRVEAPLVATTDESTWHTLCEVLPPTLREPLERATKVRQIQSASVNELKDAVSDVEYIVMPEIGGWGDEDSNVDVDETMVVRLGEEL